METNFQIACNDFVSRKIDRLARPSPCELMLLERKRKDVTIMGKAARIFHSVADFGDHRRIGAVLIDMAIRLHAARGAALIQDVGSNLPIRT